MAQRSHKSRQSNLQNNSEIKVSLGRLSAFWGSAGSVFNEDKHGCLVTNNLKLQLNSNGNVFLKTFEAEIDNAVIESSALPSFTVCSEFHELDMLRSTELQTDIQ